MTRPRLPMIDGPAPVRRRLASGGRSQSLKSTGPRHARSGRKTLRQTGRPSPREPCRNRSRASWSPPARSPRLECRTSLSLTWNPRWHVDGFPRRHRVKSRATDPFRTNHRAMRAGLSVSPNASCRIAWGRAFGRGIWFGQHVLCRGAAQIRVASDRLAGRVEGLAT